MADIKKFLDQSGVSVLWTRVAEELAKKQTAIDGVKATADQNATDIASLQSRVGSLEAGTYDDTEIRGLITTNANNIQANTDAITILNGDEATAGSVKKTAAEAAAAKVAEVVAGADESFDTLKEIADWILSDTTGAAGMANDVEALKDKLEGVDSTVVDSIASAIDEALKTEGVDKYALATDLTALAARVKVLEDAGYQNAEQVGAAIDAKITALDLANTYDAKGAGAAAESNAKAYADGLAVNYDKAGAADTALTSAKTYADEVSNAVYDSIIALTADEVRAAINSASAT